MARELTALKVKCGTSRKHYYVSKVNADRVMPHPHSNNKRRNCVDGEWL